MQPLLHGMLCWRDARHPSDGLHVCSVGVLISPCGMMPACLPACLPWANLVSSPQAIPTPPLCLGCCTAEFLAHALLAPPVASRCLSWFWKMRPGQGEGACVYLSVSLDREFPDGSGDRPCFSHADKASALLDVCFSWRDRGTCRLYKERGRFQVRLDAPENHTYFG